MTVRAVVLPATPLLVPGAAGAATVLAATRAHVLRALGGLVAGCPRRVVLAPGPVLRRGRLRADLGSAGVDPRWTAWHDDGAHPGVDGVAGPADVAGLPASVALLALAAATTTATTTAASTAAATPGPAEVIEVPDDLDPVTAERLGRDLAAARDVGLVVAAGDAPRGAERGPEHLAAGVAAVLTAVTHGWTATTERSTGEHEDRAYAVTTWTDGGPPGP